MQVIERRFYGWVVGARLGLTGWVGGHDYRLLRGGVYSPSPTAVRQSTE